MRQAFVIELTGTALCVRASDDGQCSWTSDTRRAARFSSEEEALEFAATHFNGAVQVAALPAGW